MPKLQIRSYDDDTFRQNVIPTNQIWTNKNTERELAYLISERAFVNIREFPYVYFTNGITESINYLVPQQKTRILPNEYRYLRVFRTVSENSGDLMYLSYPYSGNGKFYEIPKNYEVILDCAYIFASNMTHEKVLPDNVTHVLFGLSKSHNLPDYRIGWMFSKNMIKRYHILQYEYDYYVSLNVSNSLKLVYSYEPNYLYKRYSEHFLTLYKKHKLSVNDTNLFALSETGEKIPWYSLQ